jgi:hypothetical protein
VPVQPVPTPFSWDWNTAPGLVADADGQPQHRQLVTLTLMTVTGTVHLWLSPEDADRFLEQGRDRVIEARTGIQRAVQLPLDGQRPPG